MKTQRWRAFQLGVILLAGLASATCGNGNGSPASPSAQPGAGGSFGATVQGTVNGSSGSATFRTAATHAACGADITMTFKETGESAAVDCAGGEFMFTNVPPDLSTVTLTFDLGSGNTHTESLDAVGEGETLEVEVTIANGIVTVVEIEREDQPVGGFLGQLTPTSRTARFLSGRRGTSW